MKIQVHHLLSHDWLHALNIVLCLSFLRVALGKGTSAALETGLLEWTIELPPPFAEVSVGVAAALCLGYVAATFTEHMVGKFGVAHASSEAP